jgi:hypothetical protein
MKSFIAKVESTRNTGFVRLKKNPRYIFLVKVIRLTKNPRWHLMRLLARFYFGRLLLKYIHIMLESCEFLVARKHQKSQSIYCHQTSDKSTLFPDVDIERVVDGLRRDGLSLGINLPQDVVREISIFAENQPCFGNRDVRYGFYQSDLVNAEKYYKQRFSLASYYNTASLCPAIKSLQQDRTLLEISQRYFGHRAVCISSMLWWSFANEVTQEQRQKSFQMFHYDVDDFAFLKFFFYFTDVDLSAGPHVCILGSHKKKKLSHQMFPGMETDDSMIQYYGNGRILSICGDAGFGFVEDTFCFHKGQVPLARNRLIMQVEFAVTDYGMQNDVYDSSLLHVKPIPA